MIRGRAIGSGSSFSSSVTTNAAAVPASRSRTRIVRRCRPRPPSVETGCSGPVKDRRGTWLPWPPWGRLFLAGIVGLALFAGTAQEARAADACGLPKEGGCHCMGRLRRRLRALLVPLRPARDHRRRLELHLPAEAPVGRREDRVLRPVHEQPGRDAGQADDRAGDGQLGPPDLLPGRRVGGLLSAVDGAERALRCAHDDPLDSQQRAQYRHNIIVFAKTLRGSVPDRSSSSRAGRTHRATPELVARGVALCRPRAGGLLHRPPDPSPGHGGGEPHAQKPLPGGRADVHGHRDPVAQVGIMLGFQASNRGSLPPIAWFGTSSSRRSRRSSGARGADRHRLVVGLAGAELGPGRSDKEVGACIWLWTRDPRLCAGP